MQRTEPDGVVISCDFCQTDWDGQSAMIEGHHGSVICLECLKKAVDEARAGEGKYQCTLCLRINIPPGLPRWHFPGRSEKLVCQECLQQAVQTMRRSHLWPGSEKPL